MPSRDKRFLELKDFLLSRGYRPKVIDSAIEKVKLISRDEAIKKKLNQKKEDRNVFVLTYNPALPSLSKILSYSIGNLDILIINRKLMACAINPK